MFVNGVLLAELLTFGSQVPRRLFSFWSGTWRRAWGGAKGRAKNCGLVLLSCHASPQSPVLAAAGTGKRKETTGDLARHLGILRFRLQRVWVPVTARD